MKQINKIVYEELKPLILKVALIFVLIFLGVSLETIAPWSFKVLIDNVLGSEVLDRDTIVGGLLSFLTSRESLGFFVVLIYFASTISSSLIEYFVGVLTKKLNRQVILNFAQKAFESLERLSIGFYKKQEIGDYIYRLSYDVASLGVLLEEGLLPLVNNALFVVVTLGIMFYINTQLTLLALCILPFFILTLGIFNHRIGSASQKSETSNSALFSFIQQVLSQLKIIQAFNREKKEAATFRIVEDTSLAQELNMYGLGFAMNLLIGVVIGVGYSIIIAYGMKLVFSEVISTGLLIVFILYLDNLTQPVLSFVTGLTAIRENYVKVSRMNDFFTTSFYAANLGTVRKLSSSDITFKGVSVLTDRGFKILKNVSFTIPQGKRTVVVGVNGSGKTSIISLLMRFLEPTQGQILLGNEPLKNFELKALRDAISYVPQEIVLFDDSIKNNIAFSNQVVSMPIIRAAAKLAVAESFIAKLPDQYNFQVGEDGLNLSGGQRQRIMLARAFTKQAAKFVIMDEPLSALDVDTRTQVMQNINHFCEHKTTIIISNILEIVNQADYIIVVSYGKILHTGSPQSLLQQKKLTNLLLNSA